MTNLKEQKAIVTGGLNGIGKKVAETLLEQNAEVVILDIAENQWDSVKIEWEKSFTNGKFHFIKCDIRNREETISAFEKAYDMLKGLDVLINNAGLSDELYWEKTIDINLKAMIRNAYIGMNLMSKAKGKNGGVIVNSASISGLVNVKFPIPVYCATKHAVTAFTRSIAAIPGFLDLHGVRLNSVCLGFVQTDIVKPPVLKQSKELDDCPFLDSFNNMKSQLEAFMKFEDMIPVEKATTLYLKLIDDKEAHGKNLYYTDMKQDEPRYHEFKDIFT